MSTALQNHVRHILGKLCNGGAPMPDDLRARAKDFAGWCLEQRYAQGYAERVARRAEAVLRAAVEAEREACCRAACPWCGQVNGGKPIKREEKGGWYHGEIRCAASAIRARKP
jgi:hypothetical protein